MAGKKSFATEFWYWTRIAISIVSFGMIYPNALTERMETERPGKESLKRSEPGSP